MKKLALLVIIVLCIVGCDSPYTPPIGTYSPVRVIKIDSAYACCGVDSFAIKKEWVKQEIDAFLADSANKKEQWPTALSFAHFKDSLDNDYIVLNDYVICNSEGDTIIDLYPLFLEGTPNPYYMYEPYWFVRLALGKLPNI